MTINELIKNLEEYKQENNLDGNQEIICANENDTASCFKLGPAYTNGEIDIKYVFMY